MQLQLVVTTGDSISIGQVVSMQLELHTHNRFNITCLVLKKKRNRWKEYREKPDVKRRRAHRQEATERRILYENRTAEYGSGMGLDLGNTATNNTTRRTRTKRTKCRCGATTHLTVRHRECRLNLRNLLNTTICEEINAGGDEEINVGTAYLDGESHRTSNI